MCLMCDHHTRSLCSRGVDSVHHSCANSPSNDSHAFMLFFFLPLPLSLRLHTNTSFIHVTYITHLVVIYGFSHRCQIVFTSEFVLGVELNAKSNL